MGIICKLEDDLILPKYWLSLYDEMPKECQEIIDDKLCAFGIGIGRNEKLG